MKLTLLLALLLMLLLPLMASGLEDTVDEMLSMGRVTYIDGDNVFMSSTYWSDKMFAESQAYRFVSLSAYYFLAVHHEWDTISSASTLSTINTTDCIACPWTNGYGEALLTIRLSDVYENFGSNSYEELGEEDLLSAIDTFVHSNGDRSKLDFEEEDEY